MLLAGLGRELLGDEVLGVHAYDQHLLVVGAVEDPDPAARRQALLIAAQVVLVKLARGRDLEALDPHALRVDAAHHVADIPSLPAPSSVMSSGIAVLLGGVHQVMNGRL